MLTPTRKNGPHTGFYAKIRAHFVAHPDAELTYTDIMEEFGVTLRSARRVVYVLADLGILEHRHVIRLRAGRHLRERQQEEVV